MNYPTLEQINVASHIQVCQWYRFLPSPKTEEQVCIMNKISERLDFYGGWTSEISKKVGWEGF